MKELGADLVLPRGTAFPELVRKEIPGGVDGLVDTAGIAGLAIRAVRDGGRVASSVGGVQVPVDRGIETRNTFVPQYAREHAKLDHLRGLAEQGKLTPTNRPHPLGRAGHRSTPVAGSGWPPGARGAHLLRASAAAGGHPAEVSWIDADNACRSSVRCSKASAQHLGKATLPQSAERHSPP